MTRISSLIVASTLAILPVSAFAQQAGEPAKIAGPSSLTTAMPTPDKTVPGKTVTGAPVTGMPATGTTVVDKAPTSTSTAQSTQPAKPDAKTTGHGAKTDVHGMNGAGASHAKAAAPAKTTEPAKS